MFASKLSAICARSAQRTVYSQSQRMMSNRMLDILLVKDVEDLGKAGQLVSVKPGRGRNHLIPTGYAMYDTPANREKMKDIFGQDFVIEVAETEEDQKNVMLTAWEVQADTMRRLKWNFLRRPISHQDFKFKRVITKSQVLGTIRDAGFHWVTIDDIVFPKLYPEINTFGEFPIAVLLEAPDATDYVKFSIKVGVAEERGTGEEIVIEDDNLDM